MGGNRSSEKERESNHSGSYASEQSRSHEIALYLLFEHVSAATMLFDFRGLGPGGVEKRTHVFLRLGSLPEQAVGKLGKENHLVKRAYELLPFTLCQTCSVTFS